MAELEELGRQAYQKQIWGDYKGAITIYTNAIKKFPKDPRFLNNRSCCYMEKKDFKSALKDAETMVKLFPNYIKSYYRKGEALFGLKRYGEAEQAFRKVLSMDFSCEEAFQQIQEIQTLQLMDKGHSKSLALQALRATNYSLEEALRLVQLGLITPNNEDYSMNDIYYSDEEENSKAAASAEGEEYNALLDPLNPLGATSLWIGFVSEDVTEEELKKLFSKHGALKSVLVYHSKHCAFVNFFDAESAGRAMKNLQGVMVRGKNLLLKFPDNTSKNNLGLTGPSGLKKDKGKLN